MKKINPYQKFVKFKYRDGTSDTFTEEYAEKILDSDDQLVKVLDYEGNWTLRTLNLSEIVGTYRDYEEERRWRDKYLPRLPEPKRGNTAESAKIKEVKANMRKLTTKWKNESGKPNIDSPITKKSS